MRRASRRPGALKELIPLTITRVESLRDGISEQGNGWSITRWREDVSTALDPEFATRESGIVYRHRNVRYVAAWPDGDLLEGIIERMANEAGVPLMKLPEGLRLRRTAGHLLAVNYSSEPVNTAGIGNGKPIIGTTILPPAGVAAWTLE